MADRIASRYLLAIDPGIDQCGWAAFDRHLLAAGLTIEARTGPALVDLGRLETDLAHELGARLEALAQGLTALFWRPGLAPGDLRLEPAETAVVIERPAAVALYGRHARQGKRLVQLYHDLEKLQLAIGVLHGAAQAAHVAAIHLVPSPRTPKAQKQQLARRILAARGGPVPRTIEDERDAITLGAWFLETGVSRARVETARRAAGVGSG